MKAIEAVIFDCDGTIVDSDELKKNAKQKTAPGFAEIHGLSFDAESVDWDSMRGWPCKNIAANIFGVSIDSDIADKYRLAVVEKTVEIADCDSVPLIPGITAFINYLAHRGLKQGLATSSNRRIYSKYCEVNQMDFFHPGYIVAYGECRDEKPKPGPFVEVMKRMHVAPDHTLVIEDSGSGITAGWYAGAFVLGVATTKPTEYLHTETDAHLVAKDFIDAARLLQPYLPN